MASDNLGPAKVTSTSSYSAPNPASARGDSGLLLLAAAGAGVLLLMHRSSTSTTTTVTTPTTTTTSTSPSLGVPGAPIELQQVGGTATSVTVECAAVEGAVQYDWYQYGTNLLLATSPSNVAVIDGLQTNTGYEVYCTAVNIDGQQGPPSQPLLVTTGAGSPVVYVNNYGSSSTTQPAPSTTTTTTTSPTLPTGQTLAMVADPGSPTVNESTTVTASSTALATYLLDLLNGGGSEPTVSWQWIIRSPSGSAVVNQTVANTASDSSETFTPNSAGEWAVTVTCSVGGKTVGQGSLGVVAVAPYVAPTTTPTNPSTYPSVTSTEPFTPTNLQNPVYKSPSGVLVIGPQASSLDRIQAIQHAIDVGMGISIPGLSPAQAGYVRSVVEQYGNAIDGVLNNGVVVMNPNATQSQKMALLKNKVPVSIPGLSPAQVGYLGQLARQGKISGITSDGQPIYTNTSSSPVQYAAQVHATTSAPDYVAPVTHTEPVYVAPSTTATNTSSSASSTRLGRTVHELSSGVIAVGSQVSNEQRLQAIQQAAASGKGVSLPGLSAAQAGYVKSVVQEHSNAISGVLNNGVVVVSPNAPQSQKLALLREGVPISIPGVSAAGVAYLAQLARQGKIVGVSADGKPIY